MQSAVFALSPEAAAEVVIHILQRGLTELRQQDVRDIDEAALRQGQLKSQYYGSMLVPSQPQLMQQVKQAATQDQQLVFDDIAEQLTQLMTDSETVMLSGPGRTNAHWMDSLGLANTLVGFDAVKDGELLQSDLTAKDIARWLQDFPDLLVVLSPTGNQGMLLGRGNQQLSPAVLSQLNKSQLLIVASPQKIQALNRKPMVVDSNDRQLDEKLCGLYPVIIGFEQQILYPIHLSYSE